MSSDDADRLVVPKFGSFKTKPSEPNQRPDKTRGRDESKKSHSSQPRDEGRRRHRSRESHRHKEHDNSDRRKDSRKTHEIHSSRGISDTRADFFVFDTKGDPLIRRYGTLDKAHVPAYRRHGYGKVLGTEGRLIIYHEGSRDYFSLRMPGEGPPRYRDRDGLRSKRPSAHPAPITIKKHALSSNESDDGFIPLGGSRKRKRLEGSSDEDDQPSYRSIEGKAKVRHMDGDTDTDSDESVEVDESELNNPLKWKSIQLNRTVKESPDNIDAWLELADHQDELLRAQTADGTTLDNETHSYKEIKVSMLESALENAKEPSERERVLVDLMREGGAIWSSKVAAKKWADLKGRDKSHSLWKVEIAFMMSNVAQFQYDAIKAAFTERLQFVVSKAGQQSLDGFREAIYIFLRTTRFIHDSGYRELAVAAWQAMLEITFFRPSAEEQFTSIPASFQDFWESEVSRIGDDGAKGWGQFVEDGGQGDPPEPVTQPPVRETSSRDSYKAWASLESEHSRNAKMPARTMDDGTEDDPFRVVTFCDIEPLLFMIPIATLPSLKAEITDAYLRFCGLPPQSLTNTAEDYYQDQFISPSGCSIPDVSSKTSPGEVEELQRRDPFGSGCHMRAAWAPELLFSGKGWFHLLDTERMGKNVSLNWVGAVLKRLLYEAKMSTMPEYYLAFTYARDAASVKKAAKSLIKQWPGDINLYNCYSIAEFSNGNFGVAEKVLSSAAASSLLDTNSARFQLHLTWAWMLLVKGNLSEAKRRLCASADDSSGNNAVETHVSSTGVLKAQTTFSASLSEYLAVGDLSAAATTVECLTMLKYLAGDSATEPMSGSQGNISAAMATLESASQGFSSRGYSQSVNYERVVQFAGHLLYIHARKGPHRRVYIQEQLAQYIHIFPSNSVLLSLYEWADAGMRIIDETRRLLTDKVLTPKKDSISSRIFAIQHEISRGNLNTAKSAFEQALRSDLCKSNIMLWTWYIRFSYSHREFRSKAKDVFYRALRHCPWSKDILMEAFVTLAREMKSDELKSVYNMMTTKGLRVHVDMEEFLERKRSEQPKDR